MPWPSEQVFSNGRLNLVPQSLFVINWGCHAPSAMACSIRLSLRGVACDMTVVPNVQTQKNPHGGRQAAPCRCLIALRTQCGRCSCEESWLPEVQGMARKIRYRQGMPRLTCLIEYVHRFPWFHSMPKATQRSLIATTYGKWSAATFEEEIERLSALEERFTPSTSRPSH